MKPPRDYFECDPGWCYCPNCDRDYDSKPGEHGLCPDCEKKRQAEEAARANEEDDEEEYA